MKLTDEHIGLLIADMTEEVHVDYGTVLNCSLFTFARAIEAACQPKWMPMDTVPDGRFIDVLLGSRENPEFRLRITDVCKNSSHSNGWSGIPREYLDSSVYYFIGWMPLPEVE